MALTTVLLAPVPAAVLAATRRNTRAPFVSPKTVAVVAVETPSATVTHPSVELRDCCTT
jgi:hypothetical protein